MKTERDKIRDRILPLEPVQALVGRKVLTPDGLIGEVARLARGGLGRRVVVRCVDKERVYAAENVRVLP